MNDNLVNIKFETNNEPIIKARLLNQDVYLLVDSGSETGILNSSFFDMYASPELEPISANEINGVNGNSETYYDFKLNTLISNTLFMDVVFSVGDCNGIMSQYSEHNGIDIKGIIGRKFLYDNGFVLDFKNNRMYELNDN